MSGLKRFLQNRPLWVVLLPLNCCFFVIFIVYISALAPDPQATRSTRSTPPRHIDPPKPNAEHSLLLIGIISSLNPDSRSRRDAVRSTWLQWSQTTEAAGLVRHLFIVGVHSCRSSPTSETLLGGDSPSMIFKESESESEEKRYYADSAGGDGKPTAVCSPDQLAIEERLIEEAEQFGDILRVDVEDKANPGYKTLALHRYAASRQGSQPRFVMKTDDDVFVRLDRIVDELHSRLRTPTAAATPPLSWGFFWKQVPQSAESFDQRWPLDTFPPFASGVCNVVGQQLSSFVGRSWSTLQVLDSEEASMGVWLAGQQKEIGRAHV